MTNQYLKSFVIGSSFPVFIQFFISVSLMNKVRNYSYESYTLIAPLYLGLMNMLSLYIGNKYNLLLGRRLFYTSIISPIIVILFVTLNKSYNFTNAERNKYYCIIFIKYFIAFNIIIYFLESNI